MTWNETENEHEKEYEDYVKLNSNDDFKEIDDMKWKWRYKRTCKSKWKLSEITWHDLKWKRNGIRIPGGWNLIKWNLVKLTRN